MKPYYEQDGITIYHGDCREIVEWITAAALVTDPPYGRGWKQGALKLSGSDSHPGITGDATTEARDEALSLWGDRPALVFGDLMLAPPERTRQVLVYRKATNAGMRGATANYRRDIEAVYLVGPWPSGIANRGKSSILTSAVRSAGNPSSPQGRFDHPHCKPIDLMTDLVSLSVGTVADPFMGSGSTLVAAKQMGRSAVGVEIEERYCEIAAKRLEQGVFELSSPPVGTQAKEN